MNPESFSSASSNTTVHKSSRIESIAFAVLLISVVLAPLVFIPTPYIVLDVIKTTFISIGTLLAAILYGVIAYKERSVSLPPRGITWISILILISLAISSFVGMQTDKSFFGQGFELNTVSFLGIVFLAGLVVFVSASRRIERVTLIYIGMAVPFIVLAILHAVRLIFGPSVLSLGALSGITSTFIGTWYDLATYSIVVALISLSAILFLPLSRRIKFVYWVLLIVGIVGAFIINSAHVWALAALVLLGVTIVTTATRSNPLASPVVAFFKRLAWVPLILCVLSGLFFMNGDTLARPVIDKFNASYAVLSLPWQLTLDVDAGVIKTNPLFGIGPNHFNKAYIANKPIAINATYAWNAEFNYAFSLLSTFVATQGLFGTILWSLLLIFLGIYGVRMVRHLPEDRHARFMVVSSVSVAFFLWCIAAVTVPSHTLLWYTFIATALGLAVGVHHGVISLYTLAPRIGTYSRKIYTVVSIVLVIVGIVWIITVVKNTAALTYFAGGVKQLTVDGNATSARNAFARAQAINSSDIYLQAQAEAAISEARLVANTLTPGMNASTSQAAGARIVELIGQALSYSGEAIKYDSANYYNHLSVARVSEFSLGMGISQAYDQALASYGAAIQLNRFNPSLYLSVARLHASQNKPNEALQAVGLALQAKNNYLEAIYLLSQIEAARGNLRDAITAARVATELNPQSPLLFFQLGLLHYNNKDYVASAQALKTAVDLQSDYANAKYFLGLSYVRLNKVGEAVEQFEDLVRTNPENQEVALILSNLLEGKSPFADAQPPVTPTPEKRRSLPIEESVR